MISIREWKGQKDATWLQNKETSYPTTHLMDVFPSHGKIHEHNAHKGRNDYYGDTF